MYRIYTLGECLMDVIYAMFTYVVESMSVGGHGTARNDPYWSTTITCMINSSCSELAIAYATHRVQFLYIIAWCYGFATLL